MRLDAPGAILSADLRQLYDYWLAQHAGDRPPARADIDPTEIPRLLPDLLLVEVVEAPALRFRFRLAGTRFTQLYGENVTGRWLDELMLGDWQDFWRQEYEAVAIGWEPRHGTTAVVWQQRDYIRFEWILLPLVTRGRRCEMVLAGVHFEGQRGFKLPSEA